MTPELVVFAGPTLSRADILAEVSADVRPPVRAGDVLRACHDGYRRLCIIDGFFDRVPSVWHKEILHALESGVQVVGAASMGALRAVELAAFGMEGVGAVFEAFRDGRLDSDDEVAIAHATEGEAYRALSEALVNVRATLTAAVAAGILTTETAAALRQLAQEAFYPDRNYPALLRWGRAAGLPGPELDAFESWFPRQRVDVKHADALLALRHLRDQARSAESAPTLRWRTANTASWAALRASIDAEPSRHPGVQRAGGAPHDRVVDELLIRGQLAHVFEGGLARALAVRMDRRGAGLADRQVVQACADDFRRERALLSPASFEAWLDSERVAADQLDGFFIREAAFRRARLVIDSDLTVHLTDQMRSMGIYGSLAARAEAKQLRLECAGMKSPTLADTGLTERELWGWFFGQVVGGSTPVDLDAYAGGACTDRARLLETVIREYCYRAIEFEPPTAEPQARMS